MIRMIITDLDQTALRSDGTVSDYTRSVFDRCRKTGILVGIATARLYVNAQRQQKMLGADLLICSNGSRALLNGKTINSRGIGVQTANGLIKALLAQPSMQDILAETEETVYLNTHRFLPPHPLSRGRFTTFEQGIGEDAFQIFTGLGVPEEADEVTKAFPQCRCFHYRDSTRYAYLEKSVSKADTIERVAKILGIPLTGVAAFGDDRGDLEMLHACGMGIAVANALPEVKKSADAVTKSNDEDGVAEFIEKEILRDY